MRNAVGIGLGFPFGSGIGIGIAIGLGVGLGLGIIGCTDPVKTEAASLVAAVDRFRAAPNEQKPGLLAPLAGAACTDKDVCAAKEACLSFAKPTSDGLTLKNEVERKISDLQNGRLDRDSDEARALPMKLEEAQKLLRQGETALGACHEKTLTLRVRYRL